MPKCFVIQPFDKGAFDKRFDDILEPAIRGADLEPYRVDRDPGASIPIQQIESEIRASRICLADITVDNPNVWFELGFALAAGKEVVLVCAETREKFPFDIQHRKIITYKSESSSDFEKLKNDITTRIKAILSKEVNLESVATSIAKVEGLSNHELVTLVAIGQNVDEPSEKVSAYVIRRDMEGAGFTKIAFTVGVASLLKKGYITSDSDQDQNGNVYRLYSLTEKGITWLLTNQEILKLKILSEDELPTDSEKPADQDIPF